jgi:hypothetical protein
VGESLSSFFDDEAPKPTKQEVAKEKAKVNKRTPWQIMTTSVNKKFIPTDDEIKTVPSFMFTKWLSNDVFGALVANVINVYSHIPIGSQYRLVSALTKGKVKYIQYTKPEVTFSEEDISLIQTHYKCNRLQSIDYLEMLKTHQLEKIKKHYQYGGSTK